MLKFRKVIGGILVSLLLVSSVTTAFCGEGFTTLIGVEKPSNNEYSQICRYKSLESAQGIQFKVKIPESGGYVNPYDYINFYCGLGAYECGI